MISLALENLIQSLVLIEAQLLDTINTDYEHNWGQKIAQLAFKAEYECIRNQAYVMDDNQLIQMLKAYLKKLYQDLDCEFEAHQLRIITEIQFILEARGYNIEYYPMCIDGEYLCVRKT